MRDHAECEHEQGAGADLRAMTGGACDLYLVVPEIEGPRRKLDLRWSGLLNLDFN